MFTAKVLCRFNDIILARVFGHSDVEELAKYSSVPGITAQNCHLVSKRRFNRALFDLTSSLSPPCLSHTLCIFLFLSVSPVINALSDKYHPLQTLADLMTLKEHFKGNLKGKTLSWVGDGNNVLHDLMIGSIKMGMNVHVATPTGYEADVSTYTQIDIWRMYVISTYTQTDRDKWCV
jgi:ornithine carbamoyltransferase